MKSVPVLILASLFLMAQGCSHQPGPSPSTNQAGVGAPASSSGGPTPSSENDRIIGRWVAKQGKVEGSAPFTMLAPQGYFEPGSTVEFTKDGKVKVSHEFFYTVGKSKTEVNEGTYELKGDDLTVNLPGSFHTAPLVGKITKLTDQELVIHNQKYNYDDTLVKK